MKNKKYYYKRVILNLMFEFSLILYIFVVLIILLIVYCSFINVDISNAANENPSEWKEQKLSRIICDGKGYMTYEYNPQWEHVLYEFDQTGISDVNRVCTEKHEEEHIAFIETFWPKVCHNKNYGEIVLLDKKVLDLSECLAYVVTLNCYTNFGRRLEGVRLFHRAEELYNCNLKSSRQALKQHQVLRSQLYPEEQVELFISLEDGTRYIPQPATTITIKENNKNDK